MKSFTFGLLAVLVAILASSNIANGSSSRCNARWTLMGDFCYSFYFRPKATFAAAQRRCEDMGSTLASVHSADENQYFLDVMLRNAVPRLWIGLNDIYEEGNFQWLDGSPMDYSNWAISDINGEMIPEPNNGGTTGRAEDCTEIWRLWGHNGTWNDVPCDFKFAYVCQTDAAPVIPDPVEPAEPTLQCPHLFETIVELGTPNKTVYWVDTTENTPNVQRTHAPGDKFPVGLTVVNYTLYESDNIIATCSFSVIVLEVDTTPPKIINCPKDVGKPISDTDNDAVAVYWDEPSATDLSTVNLTSQSHYSGDKFEAGKHNVTYTFTDESGNTANCNFKVFIVTVQDDTLTSNSSGVPATVIAIILGFFLLIVLIIISAVYIRKRNKAWYARQRLVNEDEML